MYKSPTRVYNRYLVNSHLDYRVDVDKKTQWPMDMTYLLLIINNMANRDVIRSFSFPQYFYLSCLN